MASSKGLSLSSSKELSALLSSAATNSALSEEVREEAKRLSEEQQVTWRQLRPVFNAVRDLRQQDQDAEIALKSSKLVIPEVPEKTRNPELVARLAKLQRQEDDRKYKAMVADVTGAERRAEAQAEGPFATYSDQLAYGVQIIVVMGVFYLLGHVAAGSISPKASSKVVGGLIGLVIAMFVEAILLIIRSSDVSEKQRRRKSKYLSSKPAAPHLQNLPMARNGVSDSRLQKSTEARKDL